VGLVRLGRRLLPGAERESTDFYPTRALAVRRRSAYLIDKWQQPIHMQHEQQVNASDYQTAQS